MMYVRQPRLLSRDLSERRRLEPSADSLTLKDSGASEASITLSEDFPEDIRLHDWVETYTHKGSAGIFRVSNIDTGAGGHGCALTLLHGIDILNDSVWEGQTDFSGTKAEFLRQLLAHQTALVNGVQPWVLDVCEDVSHYEKSVNYDRLYDLWAGLVEAGGEFEYRYDMTVFPWRLSLVHKDGAVASEMRLGRNLSSISVTYNDAELCTRLYLAVVRTVGDEETVTIKVYNDAAAQETYGVIAKTATVEELTDAQADAWAAEFLAKHREPSVQIQMDGDEWCSLTGESLDGLTVGRLCRCALPDYRLTLLERMVSISYSRVRRQPTRVTVSLANALPTFTASIATASEAAASASRAAGAAAAAVREAEKEIVMTSSRISLIADQTGVTYEVFDKDHPGGYAIGARVLYNGVLYEFTRAHAEGADWIGPTGPDADVKPVPSMRSQIDINSSQIVINTGNINTIDGRVTTIEGSTLFTNASNLVALSGVMSVDDNGKVVIERGSGLLLTDDNGTAWGVWDRGSLTAGVMITKLNENNDTTLTIKASNIDLSGYVTADEIFATDVEIGQYLKAANAIFTNKLKLPYLDVTNYALIDDLEIGDGSILTPSITIGYKSTGGGVIGTTIDANNVDGIIKSVSVASNILTLTKLDNTTVNFSKATTLHKSGTVSADGESKAAGWAGGTFTVIGTQTNKNTTTNQNETNEVARASTTLHGIVSNGTPTKNSTLAKYLNVPLKVTYDDGDENNDTKPSTGFTETISVNASPIWTDGAAAVSAALVSATAPSGVTPAALAAGTYLLKRIVDGTDDPVAYYSVAASAQRSATGLSDTITLASTDIGISNHTATVEYDDDTDDNIPVRIDASAVYNQGLHDAGFIDVDVVRGTWENGSITFTPSAGDGASETVNLYSDIVSHNLTIPFVRLRMYDRVQSTLVNTGIAHNFYLQEADGYAYITSSNASPSSSNVYVSIPLSGSGGGAAVADIVQRGSVSYASDYKSVTIPVAALDAVDNVLLSDSISLDITDSWQAGYTIGRSEGSSYSIQSAKSVTYTQNSGNSPYTVYADTGYDAMSSVRVNVNVPQRSATGLADRITLSATDTGTSTHTATVDYDDDTDGNIPVRIDASAVYQKGYSDGAAASGTQRSATSLSSVTLSRSDIGTTSKNVTITYDSGSPQSLPISINAYNVYLEGWDDGVSSATGGSLYCSTTVRSIGTNRGNRVNAGSISKSALVAYTYLGFTIAHGTMTEDFYISIEP